MFHELYDHHASLGANTNESSKLVPSGTDIWAEYVNDKPVIIEVKAGSGAEKAGIEPGMQVLAINGKAIEQAMMPFIGRSLRSVTKDAKDYALRVALAGTHSIKRVITLSAANKAADYQPDLFDADTHSDILKTNRFGSIGYIQINDRLWDNQLITVFDSVMDSLHNTSALILDLRNTPSGGNTTVARAIISRFITKAGYYQRHELTAEEMQYGVKRSWTEMVSPRKTIYTKPLVILVDHWTGSVAEGITIGFDAFKRATIIGTQMARLNGAVYSYKMPNTGIGFSFPVERLFHVNGTPREKFEPAIIISPVKGKEAALQKALRVLQKKVKKASNSQQLSIP
jgi:C-terminal processing protease CtpA/Prc